MIDFAIVQIGEKQYRAVQNEAFECERMQGNLGETVTLEDLVLVSEKNTVLVGKDTVGYSAECVIVKQYRDDKIIVFKKKRRKDYSKKRGHRQYRTILKVVSIAKK